jgi:hypothetical protein
MKVLLGTPVARSEVTTTYATSLFRLLDHVSTTRADVVLSRPVFLSGALVARSRNILASLVLQDPSLTHLLFIDADMGFRPEAVMRMLDFGKEFVGCACPARGIDPEKAFRAAKAAGSAAEASALALDYVVARNLIRAPEGYAVNRGFVRTRQVGAALTLISRSVLEKMKQAYPDLCAPVNESFRAHGIEHEVCQFFEPLKADNGLYMAEELIGGEMWILIEEPITHVGTQPFTGRLVDQLRP